MQTFLLVFIMMVIGFAAMAIGYMVQRKSISGSCGGLGAMGIEKACDCDNPCDEKKAHMAKHERREKIKEWQKNQIN
ncbi:hypothetical protein CWE12_04560 [Aliidiomarina sedimenti]|uniref:Na(+)-translocating NADH-quinone reductase subunit E n=2 Tax=Aliidiomarina TaxID=1249554 RepID=A0A432WL87_9GAMM|nr:MULTISPECIES: (Na+)-NQR maturation NqrM [Aliidiomarina]RUO32252.1 hypothetical protein CWE12_04560 [Aliidiomarina sedimenti]RUO34449.1 hypothetical protein CWE14_00065 [Aliidiomarina soli]